MSATAEDRMTGALHVVIAFALVLPVVVVMAAWLTIRTIESHRSHLPPRVSAAIEERIRCHKVAQGQADIDRCDRQFEGDLK